jgi:hypothetical protein
MNAKTLKEIASGIKVDFVRVGFNPETEQTKWVCLINGQSFDFHCGLFACIPEKVEREKHLQMSLSKYKYPLRDLERRYSMASLGSFEKERAFKMIRQGRVKAIKNWNVREIREVFEDISKLCAPTAYDLLYCLKSDSEALSMSFCGNFGYDNDSIKALNIYNECVASARKLQKALGHDKFKELMEAQDE